MHRAPCTIVILFASLAIFSGVLRSQAPVPPTWGGVPPPTTYVTSIHGSWGPVLDWTSFFNVPPQGLYDAELGHAALITSGSHRGKIVLWNLDAPVSTAVPPVQNPTLETYLFDPSIPQVLTVMTQTPNFASDIFCSGMSTLSDGRLLVCGGFQLINAPLAAPIESYLFEPLLIDTGIAWQFPAITVDENGGALEPRYYPGLIPLTADFNGKHLLIGGQTSVGTLPAVPELRIFKEDTSEFSAGVLAPLTGPAGYTFHPETYPRGFQISDGRVFLAGDVSGNAAGDVLTASGAQSIMAAPRNQLTTFPGDTFFLSFDSQTGLPTSVTLGPRLDEDVAPSSSSLVPPLPATTTPPVPATPVEYRDLGYGSSVLLHCLPANGGLDRMLIFGGSEGWSKASETSSNQVFSYPLKVHDRVQEISFAGGGGNWHDKTPMNIRRVFLNATVLPTREVFLSGGSATNPITYGFLHDNMQSTIFGQDANGFWLPVFLSELYDPGTSATASGSTRYLALPSPNALVADETINPATNPVVDPNFPWTPRVYHHLSMLLPDGSVLVFGGNNATVSEVAFAIILAKSNHTGEIYYPPYYFEPRSGITTAPSSAYFSSSFSLTIKDLPPNHVVEHVVLIKAGTLTHHFDANQRYLELSHDVEGSPKPGYLTIKVEAPPKNLGPAGSYLLFVMTTDGTIRAPSNGVFIDLK
ncbi:MAG: galactose oxidase-like domain-containing protein [Planctomycetota bacterium]